MGATTSFGASHDDPEELYHSLRAKAMGFLANEGDSLDELRLAPSKGVSLTLLLGLGVSVFLDEESAWRLRVLPVEYVYGVELFRTFERSMRGGVVPNK